MSKRWLSLPSIFGRPRPRPAPEPPPDDDRARVLPMTLDDLDEVLEVEHGAFTTPWSRRQFVSELTQNNYAVYLVIKRGRRTIAYGGMWAVLGEAHITNVAVRAEERGRKIGDLLLRALLIEAESRDCLKVTLEVRRSNAVAQNLYRKYGFLERGVRRGYYTDDGEDAFVMVREGAKGDAALRVPPAPEAGAAEDAMDALSGGGGPPGGGPPPHTR